MKVEAVQKIIGHSYFPSNMSWYSSSFSMVPFKKFLFFLIALVLCSK